MAEAKLDLLVVAAYGYRAPVADLRSIDAMVNVHPSFLPEGRGPNHWSIWPTGERVGPVGPG